MGSFSTVQIARLQLHLVCRELSNFSGTELKDSDNVYEEGGGSFVWNKVLPPLDLFLLQ